MKIMYSWYYRCNTRVAS